MPHFLNKNSIFSQYKNVSQLLIVLTGLDVEPVWFFDVARFDSLVELIEAGKQQLLLGRKCSDFASVPHKFRPTAFYIQHLNNLVSRNIGNESVELYFRKRKRERVRENRKRIHIHTFTRTLGISKQFGSYCTRRRRRFNEKNVISPFQHHP